MKEKQEARRIPPRSQLWQYGSVEGKATGKKAILTITYPEFRFQFGFLIADSAYAGFNPFLVPFLRPNHPSRGIRCKRITQ